MLAAQTLTDLEAELHTYQLLGEYTIATSLRVAFHRVVIEPGKLS